MVLNNRQEVRSFGLEELQVKLKAWGEPVYRAKQIMEWLHKKHAMDFTEMKNLGKPLQEKLATHFSASSLSLKEIPEDSNHESSKFLFETQDGHFLESVLITQRDRRTVCVSTQLGCKIGCPFCASGKGKFIRHLTAGEIVEQISAVACHIKKPCHSESFGACHSERSEESMSRDPSAPPQDDRNAITNVVFMGMGEPLDNYDATVRAIEILMADWGFEMGGRRITVSTSGLIPKIEQFVKHFEGKVRLSVSLHSSKQDVRSQLVPINKKYPLAELVKSLDQLHRQLKRDITFEYTLIHGINDSIEEAAGVAKIAYQLNAKVNIIPYNPIKEMDFTRPTEKQISVFCKVLEEKGVRVMVRKTAGRDIDAACGQLRLDRESS